jgi:HPr kinase/phosphorylase
MLVHGTAIAIDGGAILLRGPPGAGKSDLALRLIDGGACLVADDQTELRRAELRVWVSAPAALAGLIEVRGIGILRVDALIEAPLVMCVDLVLSDEIERLPQRRFANLLGLEIPLIAVSAFEASAAAKLRFAHRVFLDERLPAIIQES